MSFLSDGLLVVTLEYGSRLVCVGFWLLHIVKAFASRHLLVHDEDWHLLQIWNAGFLRVASSWDRLLSRKFYPEFDTGVYFVGVVVLSPSFVTFDVRPSGMASF